MAKIFQWPVLKLARKLHFNMNYLQSLKIHQIEC